MPGGAALPPDSVTAGGAGSRGSPARVGAGVSSSRDSFASPETGELAERVSSMVLESGPTGGRMADGWPRYDLYVITDPSLSRGRSHIEVARAALEGGADAIQIRDKSSTAYNLGLVTAEIQPLARQFGAALLVNDRGAVAVLAGAAGAHPGPDDLPARPARRRTSRGPRAPSSAASRRRASLLEWPGQAPGRLDEARPHHRRLGLRRRRRHPGRPQALRRPRRVRPLGDHRRHRTEHRPRQPHPGDRAAARRRADPRRRRGYRRRPREDRQAGEPADRTSRGRRPVTPCDPDPGRGPGDGIETGR